MTASSGAATLLDHRHRWEKKPVLRELYEGFTRRARPSLKPGRVVEIGAGPGTLELDAGTIRLDVLQVPWLDVVADAGRLPFAAGSIDSIVMVDVLHHLPDVRAFFAETSRVLDDDGTLVLLEPAITPVSHLFYRFLHPERVDLTADPLGSAPLSSDDPFDANQALATLLFGKPSRIGRFHRTFPGLRVASVRHRDPIAYPLSGGYRRWSLLPRGSVAPLMRAESRLPESVLAVIGFRMDVVIHRVRPSDAPL